MTIHYHGTPLTPRSEMLKMAGKCFCVSFANPGDAEWCLLNGQSILWDNGEYVFYKRRIAKLACGIRAEAKTDWTKFYEWVEPKLGHPHWAVVPDVIGGGVDDNLALIKQWPFRRETAAVVWHLDESIEHLIALVELGFGKICFGSAGEYWQVGSVKWARRVEEALDALIRYFGHLPWIHMLRGLAVCGDVWPFASADSTNVARNFKNKGSEVCPERMARRIDAVQCPVAWALKPTNHHQRGDLFYDIAC